MTSKLAAAAIVLATGILIGSVQADEKITLKPKYAPGKYLHTTDHETVTHRTSATTAAENKLTSVTEWVLTIDRPDEQGVKKATFQYRRLATFEDSGGKRFSYESNQPPGDDHDAQQLSLVYGPATKTPVTVLIGADERIREVRGLDAMWDGLAKDEPGYADVKKSIGDAGVKDAIEKTFELLPAKPVAVGDEWTISWPWPVESQVDKVGLKTALRLKALEDDGKVAVIEFAAKTEPPKPAAKPVNEPAKPAPNAVQIAIDGTLRVNIANPLLTGLDGTMKVSSPPGQAAKTTTSKIIEKTQLVETGGPVQHLLPSPFKDEVKPPGK